MFKHLFGTSLPIIQAPLAGIQGSTMALAVNAVGGLGSLPAAMLSLEDLQRELTILQAQGQPYNVNFFSHTPPTPDAQREADWRAALAPYYAELGLELDAIPVGPARTPFSAAAAALLAQVRPPVVSFHFGLPAPELLAQVRATGAKILSTATTVEEARWLAAQGVDAIIAQGIEAGGHRGTFLSHDLSSQLSTLALVPQIIDAVNIPVIATGGIADARGVAAVLALGAVAAQVGTSYMLCTEAKTSPLHRAALISEAANFTAVTNLFTGRPARGIVNRIMRELGPMQAGIPPFPMAAAAMAPLRTRAEERGFTDFSPLWAGQNATGCRNVSAGELTLGLVG
ncbi:MAG: nitronate monooxygenase [Candidatus Viridilinea halotolerans]|uniref:Probable nitronate monooxygenase n=1 Tax=Candidatus Viridilinea halotolerans TaxID=2491704 RepID=A0A426TXM0_9CHLR|nr:MAG: nitronate monooxygenase [Candidatus Viridilinea halotolerans]